MVPNKSNDYVEEEHEEPDFVKFDATSGTKEALKYDSVDKELENEDNTARAMSDAAKGQYETFQHTISQPT